MTRSLFGNKENKLNAYKQLGKIDQSIYGEQWVGENFKLISLFHYLIT